MSAAEYVVWGAHPAYAGGEPIRLTSGTLPHCRREVEYRKRGAGWALVIRKAGSSHNLSVSAPC